MGQALYRKYRSKKLTEIIGQEHITDTLTQALKQGKISHAYLFTGPRGVGKTSIARILAHEVNGLPYTDDSAHMDIIEIDAASNRRIDEIRELRDKVHVAPTSAKYKVYIIDEVHMLTKEAFNALLKTLEEPPAHAVFILATTDAHKLPDTIVSRTQRYNFKPVATSTVKDHLRYIAKQENIKVSDEALELLAAHGEGSFRDSISMLDQAAGKANSLELSDIQSLLGIPPADTINILLGMIASGESAGLVSQLEALYTQGFQAAAIAKQLSLLLRRLLVDGNSQLDQGKLFSLLESLLEVPIAHNPERYLEIVLLKALPSTTESAAEPVQTLAAVLTNNTATKPAELEKPSPKVAESSMHEALTQSETPKIAKQKASNSENAFNEAIWPQVLQQLKQKNNTLYGVVRMAQPEFSGDKVVLTFQFAFHQKRVNESSNRQVLSSVIRSLTGQDVTIECLFDKTITTPHVTVSVPEPTKNTSMAAISNIFGGGELLES